MSQSSFRTGSETLIFWGAGATAKLGMPTTENQTKAIKELIGSLHDAPSLAERVRNSGISREESWNILLEDLLMVLGDDLPSGTPVGHISEETREAMKRHEDNQHDEKIVHLRTLFDWAALKEVGYISPGFSHSQGFTLQDLFNILDIHIAAGQGFPVNNWHNLDHTRVVGAKRALQMILGTFFFVRWHIALKEKKDLLATYLEFGRMLGRYHQETGVSRALEGKNLKSREFYLGKVAFASLNYDPLCMWAQFVANYELNNNYPPFVGFPATSLRIFHDLGTFIPTSALCYKTPALPKRHINAKPCNHRAWRFFIVHSSGFSKL